MSGEAGLRGESRSPRFRGSHKVACGGGPGVCRGKERNIRGGTERRKRTRKREGCLITWAPCGQVGARAPGAHRVDDGGARLALHVTQQYFAKSHNELARFVKADLVVLREKGMWVMVD